jgi:hypothetical protein
MRFFHIHGAPMTKKSPLRTSKMALRNTRSAIENYSFVPTELCKMVWCIFGFDTCRIDKSNFPKLHESINCMYRWYEASSKCYVYLSDVSNDNFINEDQKRSAIRQSRWFKRGWTLQELLAPRCVEFYTCSQQNEFLGNRQSLAEIITNATGIPIRALNGLISTQFSIEDQMDWVKCRQIKKKEDMAYCLFGIFGVSMPINYGEGEALLSKDFTRS